MKKSIKKELNKYLNEMSSEELKKEINILYRKFNDVKKYYEVEFSDDTSVILMQYKKEIENEYFPKRGYGKARNSVSKKVITEFKKISISPIDVVELTLFRVKMMIDFTSTYGDIDDAFYNSLESSFNDACKLINKEGLEEKFRETCEDLIDETNTFGWGLYDALTSIYDDFFNE